MTTYHYKTSFSAAFQGAIDHLDIFRGTENCRSNRFGVTQILPPRLRCGIDGPRQLPFRRLCFLYRKGSRDEPPPGDQRTSGLASAWGTSRRKILALLVPGVRQLIFQMEQSVQSHSKPLSCPECPFRTARGTRLRQHIEKNHPGCQSAPRRHFSKQLGSKFLKKPH